MRSIQFNSPVIPEIDADAFNSIPETSRQTNDSPLNRINLTVARIEWCPFSDTGTLGIKKSQGERFCGCVDTNPA
jgi:hypothetical protein